MHCLRVRVQDTGASTTKHDKHHAGEQQHVLAVISPVISR